MFEDVDKMKPENLANDEVYREGVAYLVDKAVNSNWGLKPIEQVGARLIKELYAAGDDLSELEELRKQVKVLQLNNGKLKKQVEKLKNTDEDKP